MTEVFSAGSLLSARNIAAEPLPPGADGTENVRIPAASIADAVLLLRNDPSANFDLLLSVTATDFKDRIEVLYHLYSSGTSRTVNVKANLDPAAPRIPSICRIHSAANYYERETYDLVGVVFDGHPDLRRILLPYSWKGHPLRKDYVMDDERLKWNSR